MTTPNMPGPNGPIGNHGNPGPGSQQWGNQQQAPNGPAGGPSAGSTATSTKSASLPGWPTFAAIGLFLLTLISSFFPILTLKSDKEAQRAQLEEEFGGLDLNIDDFLLDFTVTMNWWARAKFKTADSSEIAKEIENEFSNTAEFEDFQVVLIALTALVLVAYISAIVLGFLKLERFGIMAGLAAAAFQVIAIIVAVLNYADANDEPEIKDLLQVSFGGGFWIWVLLAIAAIAAFVFALINGGSKKSPSAPAFASSGQPGQPQGFGPGQPQQQGFQQGQPFSPQGQPGSGFNPGQQPGPGAGNPYQQFGR